MKGGRGEEWSGDCGGDLKWVTRHTFGLQLLSLVPLSLLMLLPYGFLL